MFALLRDLGQEIHPYIIYIFIGTPIAVPITLLAVRLGRVVAPGWRTAFYALPLVMPPLTYAVTLLLFGSCRMSVDGSLLPLNIVCRLGGYLGSFVLPLVVLSVLAFVYRIVLDSGRLISHLRRLEEVTDADLLSRFRELAERSGITAPRLLVAQSDYPAAHAVSIIRPGVIVTRGLLDKLEAPELDAVLAHELSHIRRRDTLFTLMLGLLSALQAFNPFAGLMMKLALGEREKVCDAEAARITGNPLSLASGLLKIAQGRTLQTAESAAAGPVAERIAAVIDPGNYDKRNHLWLLLIAVAITVVLLLAIC